MVQIRCFVIAEMQSSMGNFNMRSDLVSRSACDEKVPYELPVALLTNPSEIFAGTAHDAAAS